MKKRLDPRKKKILWALAALVLTAAVGAGIYAAAASGSDPVPVYPFSMIGMTEFWGDTQESYGPVSTDRIQTIFLSETQTITEIKVKEGDTVKKGDVLMTFDTTLSDLKLEKKRLAVEKLKLKIEEAKKELKRIQHLEPMEEVEFVPGDPGLGDPGRLLETNYEPIFTDNHDGTSEERALICWLKEGRTFNGADMLGSIRDEILKFLNPPAPEPPEATTETTGETTETVPPAPPAAAPEKTLDGAFYLVFKVTEGDRENAALITWQGVRVSGEYPDFGLTFFSAPFGDYTQEEAFVDTGYVPDMGSGLTAQQILQMAVEQAKVIQDLDFKLKMEEAEYKIMLKELGDGNIYAEFDGEVASLLTEEEAQGGKQPLLKLSGGGGFHIEGTVSELVMGQLTLGQEVTINDWNTGNTYTGTIEAIGDFPDTGSSWNGMGNPNASFFPFQVYVDGDADLQAGTYVSIQYSAGEAAAGLYLENPFLRTDQGPSYIYIRNGGGRLEKRTVTTGKSLWGSYTEILAGLTAEDYIAFPYGKEVREGAKTIEGDMSSLYGY